jgi:hypothetical protein
MMSPSLPLQCEGCRTRAEGEEMSRPSTYTQTSKVFTLDVDGQPTVSFEAVNPREATQLLKESWFLNDLSDLTSDGRPLWDGASGLRIRPASDGEAERYRSFESEAGNESGDIFLAFLVTLDGS